MLKYRVTIHLGVEEPLRNAEDIMQSVLFFCHIHPYSPHQVHSSLSAKSSHCIRALDTSSLHLFHPHLSSPTVSG